MNAPTTPDLVPDVLRHLQHQLRPAGRRRRTAI